MLKRLQQIISRLSHQHRQKPNNVCHNSNVSAGSEDSIVPVSPRPTHIERKLDNIYEHTRILVQRVPADLGLLLDQLKRTLLLRLDELSQMRPANYSPQSDSPAQATDSVYAVMNALTAQERQVFQLCFNAGFLSYRELASHLDITPGSAKNLVNRMFQSDRKRPLFAKKYRHGAVRVGIRPDLDKKILAAQKDKGKKSRPIELSVSA